MKTRTIFATLAVPAAAMALYAQETVTVTGGPRESNERMVIAQGGAGVAGLVNQPGNMHFFTQEFSFSSNGKPLTGAPYSADETTESVQTLADGTRITNTTNTRVYRDSQGRTRTEMSIPGFGGFGGDVKPQMMISISDPVAGVSYSLDPERKVALQMPGMGLAAQVRVKASAQIADTMPNAVVHGTAISSARIVRRDVGEASKHEDLGDNVIEGVSAKGSRDTSTIEAGAIGNDRPITITSERWLSPELQIEVKSVRNDPRVGQTTHTVTNINRTEPDASLFQVPPDYKVEDPKMGGPFKTFEYHQ